MADFSIKQSLSSHTSEEEEVEEQEIEIEPETEELEIEIKSASPVPTLPISPVFPPNSPTTSTRSGRRQSTRSITITALSPTSEPPSSTRKPRGRPPGSKNKPKPPIYITRETEPSMRTQRLEIPSGYDIVEMVQRFARKHRVGVHVLNGSGSVSNFSLRQPAISLTGAFHLLSLSGTFIGSSVCSASTSAFIPGMSPAWLAIFVGGNNGEVFGGTIAGQVIASSIVTLNVATFSTYGYHKVAPEVNDGDDDNDPGREACKGRSAGKQVCPNSTGAGTSAMGAAAGYVVPAEHLNWAPPSTSTRPPNHPF